jgi:pyruvate dehydrogenase complex dehydrogenase (E1) component
VPSYREAIDGQILEEGISEAGAIASWTQQPPGGGPILKI